jgi:hypothetical protein
MLDLQPLPEDGEPVRRSGRGDKWNLGMTKRPHWRKTTYLGWQTHGRLVARLTLLWAAYHFTLWEALCTRQYMQYLTSLRDVEDRVPLLMFFEAYLRENAWMVIFGCVFAIVVIWDAVRLTHRIVGPLKRAENLFYAMADGKYVREVKFRKGDLVAGFERALNTYLSSPDVTAAREGRAAAEQAKPAESPAPTTSAKAPSVPLSEKHLAKLLQDLEDIDRPAACVQVD